MDEKDILQLIEAEQARRRAADAGHVRQLSREAGGDLGAWFVYKTVFIKYVKFGSDVISCSEFGLLYKQ